MKAENVVLIASHHNMDLSSRHHTFFIASDQQRPDLIDTYLSMGAHDSTHFSDERNLSQVERILLDMSILSEVYKTLTFFIYRPHFPTFIYL